MKSHVSYVKPSISNLVETVLNYVFDSGISQKKKVALLEILIISNGHVT